MLTLRGDGCLIEAATVHGLCGQRFLMNSITEQATSPITVINWKAKT
jgi:hypothetical protein